uniref:Mediator of RNA polymerase II transcription subunit 18 n=1 Tax=Panagrolaimus sp. JU765 TaxID=591449 RepID=A0AC34RBC3_9BILA
MESFHGEINPADAPVTRSMPTQNFQVLEAMLFASILDTHRDQLLERLRGVCDPHSTYFDEHELVCGLRTTESANMQLHLRRRLDTGIDVPNNVWHCRYIGPPQSEKLPAICRSAIDSLVYCPEMMDFIKNMGLRMEYEYVARGFFFTKGPIRIMVYKILVPETAGKYNKDALKPQMESHLVEAIIPVENEDTNKYAKILKDFCDQLAPLVEFKKIEYFKPKTS